MLRFIFSIILCFAAAAPLLKADVETCSGIVPMRYRNDKISITDFGGVGDGQTVNTKAFREAIFRIQHLRRRGGTLLYIPPGEFLTESFNLTSHMTLYLARGAVIKATQILVLMLYIGDETTVAGVERDKDCSHFTAKIDDHSLRSSPSFDFHGCNFRYSVRFPNSKFRSNLVIFSGGVGG